MKQVLNTTGLTVMTAVTAAGAIPAAANTAVFDFGGLIKGVQGDTLSRTRAAELYAAALQHIAGDYLDTISGDDTRALLDILEAAGTGLPEGQGTLATEDIRRFNGLGINAAAADGQMAVWVVEGDLRNGAQGVGIEMAAGRLHLAMVGRIRGAALHRDGVPAEAINPALAAVVPDTAIGIVLPVRSPADVLTEDLDATARRRQPCPDGQHGFGILQERPYIRRVRGNGQSEIEWVSTAWLETSRSCFADVVRDVTIAEQCPAPQPGFILHRVEQRIEKHPDNPYGFRVYREATSADTEISNTCGIDGKRLNTATSHETGERTRECSVAHPSNPPWYGNVRETRPIRVVKSWFGDNQADGIERRYPGPWAQQSENCSRDRTRATSRQARRSCPSSHPNGDSYRKDTGTETYREFLSGAAEQTISIAWNNDWVMTSNNCYRTWTTTRSETRTSGCNRQKRTVTEHWREWERNPANDQRTRSSSGAWSTTGTVAGCGNDSDDDGGSNKGGGGINKGGNNNGGNGGNDGDRNNGRHEGPGTVAGVDRDGDGDIDMTLTEANDPDNGVEYDKDDIIKKRDDELTPDDFRDDGDDSGGGGRGGGGCFLTTAVTAMRGEPDDGPTLTTLRDFRDGWLAETEEGRALIAEYYALAPGIVQAIPEGHAEWSWIADRIDAARVAILAGLNDAALAIYADMIHLLQQRWL
ncbi:MAG: hypothetical protein OXF40_10465 [Rhodospirillales bacterium]|nr:hypothetical protein [Rhodospirillales bacterium]